MVLVGRAGRFEVYDRPLAFQFANQINDADERQIQAGDVERENLLGRPDIPELRKFFAEELVDERLATIPQLLPRLPLAVGQGDVLGLAPGLLEKRDAPP